MSVVPFIHLPPRALYEDAVLHHPPVDIASVGKFLSFECIDGIFIFVLR